MLCVCVCACWCRKLSRESWTAAHFILLTIEKILRNARGDGRWKFSPVCLFLGNCFYLLNTSYMVRPIQLCLVWKMTKSRPITWWDDPLKTIVCVFHPKRLMKQSWRMKFDVLNITQKYTKFIHWNKLEIERLSINFVRWKLEPILFPIKKCSFLLMYFDNDQE